MRLWAGACVRCRPERCGRAHAAQGGVRQQELLRTRGARGARIRRRARRHVEPGAPRAPPRPSTPHAPPHPTPLHTPRCAPHNGRAWPASRPAGPPQAWSPNPPGLSPAAPPQPQLHPWQGICLFAMLAGFFPLDEAAAQDWRYARPPPPPPPPPPPAPPPPPTPDPAPTLALAPSFLPAPSPPASP
jgi:hypothetical protein